MRLRLFQVDAFADRVFSGNPAAVVPLERWLPDALLQAIAAENNLSETAFLVPDDGNWQIRWFTPATEVDLCGHATLASGWVVLRRLSPGADAVEFRSQSGPLRVGADGERFALTLPRRPAAPCEPPAALLRALGRAPVECLRANNLVAVLESAAAVRALRPDFEAIRALDEFGLLVTAPADVDGVDFVSRCFFPKEAVPEDPVTGSAHCTLVPYWAARLGRKRLEALQVSARGGRLSCEDLPGVVRMAGGVAPYLEGFIDVPDAP